MAIKLKNRKVHMETLILPSKLRQIVHGVITEVKNIKKNGRMRQTVLVSTDLNPRGVRFSAKEITPFLV